MTGGQRKLIGHDAAIERIVRAVAPDQPGLLLITGAPGVGRSAVLAAVAGILDDRGIGTVHIRVLRHAPDLILQVAAELSLAPSSVLLLDDLDRVAPKILHELAKMPIAIVGTYCLPIRQRHRPLRHLVREIVQLRPLGRAATKQILSDLLQATPAPDMVRTLHRACRGRPAALCLAVEGHRATGTLRTVDRTAYLVPPNAPPQLPVTHPQLRRLRLLGEPAWAVLKAFAVFHPLGPAAEDLVATALGIDEKQLRAALAQLTPHIVRTRGTWRFRVPLLASCLRQALSPWERQALSRVAVTALWTGAATCDDPTYLPERLVDAASLVDAERAGRDLLDAGSSAMLHDYHHARRWLRAAARWLADPAQRAKALYLQTITCGIHQDFPAALVSADLALSEYAEFLSVEAVQELHVIRLMGLAATRNVAALRQIAEAGERSLPGGGAREVVNRAIALFLTAQWEDAFHLLNESRSTWSSADGATATYAQIFSMDAGILRGHMADLDRIVANVDTLPLFQDPHHKPAVLSSIAKTLLALGEVDTAEQLLATHGVSSTDLSTVDAALAALREGQWDKALKQAQFALATGATDFRVIDHTALCFEIATIHAIRGRLTRARGVIDQARASRNCLPYVMDIAEADLALLRGDRDRAERLVRHGLGIATRQGMLLGTDELWLRVLVLNPNIMHKVLEELRQVVLTVGTGRTRRNYLLARVIAHRDSGAEVLRLVRRRNQPFELAETLEAVAVYAGGHAKLLYEAYEVYGELGALLSRARLRHVMRERGVTVPGRATTVAENERLLATLVAEGLTNRELADVLRMTEKSVEGRLTRLFQRFGYRSRVELATAMLTGEYPDLKDEATRTTADGVRDGLQMVI